MAESRLERWSRKKNEARKEPELAPAVTVEPEQSPEVQELAINEALAEHEVLQKYDLPDPDTIELGTDITGFLKKEIPEVLRRKALRGLWRSNPVLAVLDGLNDYDEDFTDAATPKGAVKTLYKVGQGLIDKTKKKDPHVESPAEGQSGEQLDVTDTSAPTEITEPSTPEITAEPATTTPRIESEVTAAKADQMPASKPQAVERRVEPEPRYRARMRFDD